jgi:hypothetical protein
MPEIKIPEELVAAAADHWFGDHVSVRHGASRTVRSCDGGSYTLRGVSLMAPGEGSAMIYFDEGFVIEFYDHSGGRIIPLADGRFEFRGGYGQTPSIFQKGVRK